MQAEELATSERLMAYFKGGRVHHALILAGPSRAEKFALAKDLAAFLLCPVRSEGGRCGSCSVCRRIASGLHPDVLVLQDNEDETIKIDTIREVSHQMEISPLEAKAKICIIDECHQMTPAAANAFLKTLEEPLPGRYFWLLTTQPASLLPTILSRCLKFQFKPESAMERIDDDEDRQKARLLLSEFLRTKAVAPVLSAVQEKNQTLCFLQVVQKEIRDAVLAPPSAASAWKSFPPTSLLEKYEETLLLEGNLRSNANHGLLLESYLLRNFVQNER